MSRVAMETNKGTIVLELWRDKAPQTVQNFIDYVEEGFYDGLVFHRVIDNFMIQGGGFTSSGDHRHGREAIKNEADNGVSNEIGTIAMARTNDPHSATSQFFINVANNTFLDYQSKANWGYCVFGKVTEGLEVVNAIKAVATSQNPKTQMGDWPKEEIIISSAKLI
ncbi:peptidylprolyl isomerase [bacterium]|nr:peptidylprolyl isomerase [bacterium]